MDSNRDSKRSGGHSCNPGRRSRNPYINFLRDFRRSHCGLRPVEVIRQGAQAWGRLTEEQRLPYIRESFYHPLRRRPFLCGIRIHPSSHHHELVHVGPNSLHVHRPPTGPKWANIEHHYRMCAALHYAIFMKHPLVQSLVVGKTYQGFMLQCLLNYTRVVFFLMKDTLADPQNRIISFLSPIATVFNHSCDPNVLIIPRASRIVTVVLRPVRKGEQLTSSYGPTWWDIPNLPLTFDCRCVVCVLGKKGSDWCPPGRQLPADANRELKRVCDQADDVAMLNAAQQFIQRYAALYPEVNLGGMVKLFHMLLIKVTCCETDARDRMRVLAAGII
ncbi:hypothetical protein pipiens_015001 [Culex pipiens pipiens]|uniref:SET domain-containing protein n=1 Tax=Culex pipiens pipiens TaxID=38569 RepID=A0ABD1CSB5_CULPP